MTNHPEPSLQSAPLLIEVFRGHDHHGAPIVEKTHHGIITAVNSAGDTIFSRGDIDLLSHTRSTAKPFQLLPLFDMGLFDDKNTIARLGLIQSDVVLMMSSHSGQHIHTERVHDLLKRAGLDDKALRCGCHAPYDKTTQYELWQTKTPASSLHNNCSGKHLAMLLACLHQGFDINSYEQITHPLQEWIRRLIAMMADFPSTSMSWGIDGCSLPSWVLPLKNIALMYARLGYWAKSSATTNPPFLKDACERIWQSTAAHPEYIAGDQRFDTALIRASGGQIISKGGADGIHALAIAPNQRFPLGLGLVIKIADGDPMQQIRPLVIKILLERFGVWPNDAKLDNFLPSHKNFRGLTTGGIMDYV